MIAPFLVEVGSVIVFISKIYKFELTNWVLMRYNINRYNVWLMEVDYEAKYGSKKTYLRYGQKTS